MPDVKSPNTIFSPVYSKYRDMGDGTHAEVVAAYALPADPATGLPAAPAGSPVTGSMVATGQSEAFPPGVGRDVYVRLSGTWTGTVKVQRSRDAGATWADMTVAGSPWAVFTGNCDEAVDTAGHGDFRYRLDFTRTSGALDYVLGH